MIKLCIELIDGTKLYFKMTKEKYNSTITSLLKIFREYPQSFIKIEGLFELSTDTETYVKGESVACIREDTERENLNE